VSVETEFRALLANAAGVTALVGTRVALNSVPQGSALPLIVFSVSHERTLGLDGTVLADQCTLAVQCWAETAAQADAVADAVVTAVGTATADRGAAVTARSTAFEPELGLDGVALAVDWWG